MTKAAAPPPRHPPPRSSMKLLLSTVLSFGIVGKCLLEAVLGKESKPPRTPGFPPRPGWFRAALCARPRQLLRMQKPRSSCQMLAVDFCHRGWCLEQHFFTRGSPWRLEGGLQFPSC